MKKMMVVFALCTMTFCAQAVSFDWTAKNMVDAEGAILKSAPTDGSVVLVYLGTDSGALNWTGAEVVQTANFKHATAKGKESATMSNSFAWRYGVDRWDNGDIFGVMFQGTDGSLSWLKDTADGDIMSTYQIAGVTANNTPIPAFKFSSGDYHAVPEPTTAALLALGLAAFGLKRKVRA